MKSINQQCAEVTDLLEQLQACVDRQGEIIPGRADQFAILIAVARETMGVSGCSKPANATRDLWSASGGKELTREVRWAMS